MPAPAQDPGLEHSRRDWRWSKPGPPQPNLRFRRIGCAPRLLVADDRDGFRQQIKRLAKACDHLAVLPRCNSFSTGNGTFRTDEGPEKPPIPGRGLACLTAHGPSSSVSGDEKGCLKSLFARRRSATLIHITIAHVGAQPSAKGPRELKLLLLIRSGSELLNDTGSTSSTWGRPDSLVDENNVSFCRPI